MTHLSSRPLLKKHRVLFLGGSVFQTPAIMHARKQGYEIITCDYTPDNPGHQYADAYYNVSTTDTQAVLELAQKIRPDGIIAYASDPAAYTAAYVAEQLGLPGSPPESVAILSSKDRFRKFQKKHGFYVPKSIATTSASAILEFYESQKQSIIIKPCDASGSKGVSVIDSPKAIPDAFKYALSFSRKGIVVAEHFVKRKGYQIAGDGFVVGGKLVFRCFANEHFNNTGNTLVPIGESFPSILSEEIQNRIHNEVQRLIDTIGYRTGALNFDIMLTDTNEIFIIEIGPRNGGNLIPQVIQYATGVDLIDYTIAASLGQDCTDLTLQPTDGFFASYMLHSKTTGIMDRLYISKTIAPHVIEQSIFIKKGEEVKAYNGSHCTYGTFILKFSSQKQMCELMDTISEHIKIITL